MQTIYFLKAHHAGNQYRPVLTQYHQVPTSTALYWPSIQWFDGLDHVNQIFSESISHWQPVPPCSDPVSPSTNWYRSIMTQYHQVTTNTALYWPVYRLADLSPSTWHHMNAHQGSSLTRATCHFCSANCHSEWLSSTKPDKRSFAKHETNICKNLCFEERMWEAGCSLFWCVSGPTCAALAPPPIYQSLVIVKFGLGCQPVRQAHLLPAGKTAT